MAARFMGAGVDRGVPPSLDPCRGSATPRAGTLSDVTDTPTISDLIDRAMDAYDALTSLGEDVEDEWSYVNDLSAAWRERLTATSDARGHEPATDAASIAIDRLTDEVAQIDDPHRAIDWLSTFPQVALIAIGEQP